MTLLSHAVNTCALKKSIRSTVTNCSTCYPDLGRWLITNHTEYPYIRPISPTSPLTPLEGSPSLHLNLELLSLTILASFHGR